MYHNAAVSVPVQFMTDEQALHNVMGSIIQ